MEECKCGRIPPCYSGKKFRIHEELEKIMVWDETHDKVYELNNQMCDIDKHLSEAGYFGKIYEGQVKARKKLKDMEENKTKKMTKAEAFEYLKGKKVACVSRSRDVQRKLFEVGIRWNNGYADFLPNVSFLFINTKGMTQCESRKWFDTHEYEEISADDILSIEIVEEEKEPLDKWDDFYRRVVKTQEMLDDDEVCIITKGNFITMRK